jgi:hypothetical protein
MEDTSTPCPQLQASALVQLCKKLSMATCRKDKAPQSWAGCPNHLTVSTAPPHYPERLLNC